MEPISIIIPLYNKKPYIKRTLHSVLNQTYKNFEVLIVNDGSTDDGPKVVREFNDYRIRLINQKNKGVSSARNKGISQAKYDLIALLDADDEWKPLFLENLLELLKKYPESVMFGAGYEIGGTNEKVMFKHVPEKDGIIKNYFKAAIYRNPTCSSAVLIKKDIFSNIGGFPSELRRGEDSFMWSKIALNYSISFINEPLVIRHYDSINRASMNNNIIDHFPLLEYIEENDIKLNKETKRYVNEFINQKLITRAGQSLRIGNKEKAKFFLLRSKDTKIFWRNHLKLKIISLLPKKILTILNKLKNK